MGAWGTGLFQDDTACDVRDHFTDLIGDGLTTEEATEQVLASFPSPADDPDSGRVVVIALAATQWKLGRLLESVQAQAIELIDEGADLARWDDPGLCKRRRAALAKVREQLLSPQRATTKVRKRTLASTPYSEGDVIIHKHDSGREFVLWVSGTSTDRGVNRPGNCGGSIF